MRWSIAKSHDAKSLHKAPTTSGYEPTWIIRRDLQRHHRLTVVCRRRVPAYFTIQLKSIYGYSRKNMNIRTSPTADIAELLRFEQGVISG